MLREAVGEFGRDGESAMGQFGRITSLSELPAEKVLIGYVRKAVELNDRGAKLPRRQTPSGDRKLRVPADLMAALRRNKKALTTFQGFSHSNRKEYVEWVTEAKGEETRSRRLGTAVEWMAEGKVRNWKYVRK